jgi:hypothetical protein
MEYFFKRLEAYIKVRPTAAMIDIIVEIMVEVISILRIVTKEIRQGRTSTPFAMDISPKLDLLAEKYFKKLFGMKGVEDALRRLDKLTQEEARMAAAEALTITRGIDDKVTDVDERLEGVAVKVDSIDNKVLGVDDKVGAVIEGKLYRISKPPNQSSAPFPLGVKETGVAIERVVNQVSDLKRS